MRLNESMIAEQAHMLLDGLGRDVVGLPLAIERKLQGIAHPELSWGMETASTGLLKAFAGKRRDFLFIRHARLKEYAVLILCRAHGTLLHASWMVLVSPHLGNDLRRAVRIGAERQARFEIGAELDLFDVADLKAFTGVTWLALKKAIRELTDAKDGEPEGEGSLMPGELE